MARHKVLYFPFLLHLYYALNLDHQCQSIYVSRALSMVVKIKILQGMVGGFSDWIKNQKILIIINIGNKIFF